MYYDDNTPFGVIVSDFDCSPPIKSMSQYIMIEMTQSGCIWTEGIVEWVPVI